MSAILFQADAALTRELAEELGHKLPAGKLAVIVENIYDDVALQHELGLYYQLPWPGVVAPDDLEGSIESGHKCRWTPVRELGSVRFEPAGLVPILRSSGDTLRHIVLGRPEP